METPAEPRTGFKWPVGVSRVIPAPRSTVWDVISSPGMLPLYHPFCEKNPVRDWSGADSFDEIHYFSGWVLERRFTNWYDGVGYDLEIGREGGRQSAVAWRIEEKKERRTLVTITIYPHGFQHLPVLIRWIPHLAVMRPTLGRYLESVLKGLDWFITHEEPVRRNQFGAHRWFSPVVTG